MTLVRRLFATSFLVLVAAGPVSAETVPGQPAAPVAAPAPAIARVGVGSPAFVNALSLLVAGDAPAAYEAARHIPDNTERRAVQWAAIRFGKGVDAESISRFAADAPEFDFASVYRSRLETALDVDTADKDTIIRLLGGQMPNRLDAQIALAKAYLADGQTDRARRIARSIWVDNFLSTEGEQQVRDQLGKLLVQEDFWNRAVHLLMHDRATSTERIMDRLTPAEQTLARARIAVSRDSADAGSLLNAVDPSLRTHPLYYFSLAQYKRGKGNLSAAVDALDKATAATVPDSAEFWYERRLIVRRALAEGNPELAYRAAANYTDGPEGRVVEARFHAGWVAMAFLNDAARAEPHFKKMSELSTLPDTVSQSNYWLGRAETALGNAAAAKAAYEAAARWDSLFYGQLAREALGLRSVEVRALPDWRDREAAFDALPLVQAARLLAANGQKTMAEPLVRRLGYAISEPGDFVLAARLAQEVDAHNIAILIADRAEQKGFSLDLFHFPKDGIPKGAELAVANEAAVYAVARQESHFDIDAVSSSGARGLMQLMPSTAQDVAKRLGVTYSPERLTSDAQYNLYLGSSYLKSQLDRFDNSLMLAAAAYNAGGGNVNKWLKTYGDPRGGVDPISWTELIPFAETRSYVQKVMANYLVYNARLGGQPIDMVDALKRIPG